ncbi:uncharacterized protein LOC122501768 isoform X2 [Leptopilina heterotoma]|uniref:uncharacterized protein LOC122501768 isoform X2 n=1 Tax=Leptopilina heterotoma TaxID=63436 RepID=UPI001CA9BE99|nr:uncharacterized protein LOC122501768 isoform X2 [Leptopilina heterotoma]
MLSSVICVFLCIVSSVVMENCNYRQANGITLPGTCIKSSDCKTFSESAVLFPCNDHNKELFCCPKTIEEAEEAEISCRYPWNRSTIDGVCVKPALCNNSLLNNGFVYRCHDRQSESQGLICCPKRHS